MNAARIGKGELRFRIAIAFTFLTFLSGALLYGVLYLELVQLLPLSLLDLYDELPVKLVHDIEPLVSEQIDQEKLIRVLHRIQSEMPMAEVFILDEDRTVRGTISSPPRVRDYAPVFQSSREIKIPVSRFSRHKLGVTDIFLGAPLRVEKQHGYLFVRVDANDLVPTRGMLFDYGVCLHAVLMLFFVLITAVLLGFYASRKITNPFYTLTDALLSFAGGDYSKRPFLSEKNELGVHAKAYNRMVQTVAAQISALENQDKLLRVFLGQISDTLRVPLQSLVNELRAAESSSAPLAERRALLAPLLVRCEQMNHALNDLFSIARLESSGEWKVFEAFDLQPLLEETVGDFQREAQISFARGSTEHLFCYGNEELLNTALSYLFRHAVANCKDAGALHLEVLVVGETITLKLKYPRRSPDSANDRAPSPESSAPRERVSISGFELAILQKILAIHGQKLELVTGSEEEILSFCLSSRPVDSLLS